MRMYHGTVDLFLPAIQKEGLRPVEKSAWHMWFGESQREIRDQEKVDAVYLTAIERHAIEYAETRVRYYAAKPGEPIRMFDQSQFIIRKDAGEPTLTVKPVLLIVEVDDHDDHLEDDPSDRFIAKRYVGNIPPEKIVEIRTLSPNLKSDDEKFPWKELEQIVDQQYGRGSFAIARLLGTL